MLDARRWQKRAHTRIASPFFDNWMTVHISIILGFRWTFLCASPNPSKPCQSFSNPNSLRSFRAFCLLDWCVCECVWIFMILWEFSSAFIAHITISAGWGLINLLQLPTTQRPHSMRGCCVAGFMIEWLTRTCKWPCQTMCVFGLKCVWFSPSSLSLSLSLLTARAVVCGSLKPLVSLFFFLMQICEVEGI